MDDLNKSLWLIMNQQWDHNNHYHQFLLSHLPASIDRALDIGCGYGAFASCLAKRAVQVDAIDVNMGVLNEARQRYAGQTNLRFVQGNFVTQNHPANHYHVVTALASIHHIDLVQALEEAKRILRPRGVLVILGLYQEATVSDYMFSITGMLVNFVYAYLHYRKNLTEPIKAVPTKDPMSTLAEIRATVDNILPGARIHRHALWRYSLIWQKLT